MDHSISSILGAILFAAFTIGLAESIGSAAFFIIVFIVVGMAFVDTKEVVGANTNWLDKFTKGKSSAK